ncbi:MAG: response regulator transcription factor [Verrucomicrobiaceae bacterium]|nr:response regulator transcription factor [Verrucomicrobiaceae bacterium]
MKTVLIIEDEPHMRMNIAMLLKLEGFSVLEAANGRNGVDMAREHVPDIILCDITMPDMDGFATLNTIRGTPALHSVPFIFLTARGDARDVRTGMNLGADDYLPKPFTTTDLLNAIEARIDRVQKLAEAAQPAFDSAEPLERLGVTTSEATVLLWMAQGKSNAEIAAIVGSSLATVKKHAQHIFDKLGVDNRASAMLVARDALTAARSGAH